jgi:hypothetical protein
MSNKTVGEVESQFAEEEDSYADGLLYHTTLKYLFPYRGYIFHVILIPIVSAILNFLAFSFLNPFKYQIYDSPFSRSAIDYVVFIFGWLVINNAQFSLTFHPPPEPNP